MVWPHLYSFYLLCLHLCACTRDFTTYHPLGLMTKSPKHLWEPDVCNPALILHVCTLNSKLRQTELNSLLPQQQ